MGQVRDFVAEIECLKSNTDALAQEFAEAFNGPEFAAPAAPKQKKCTKGVWCKASGNGSCISASKTCRQAVSANTAAKVQTAKQGVAGAATKGKKAQPKAKAATATATPPKGKKQANPAKSQSPKPATTVPQDQDIQAFDPGPNFKKARSFNPNAIDDLEPEAFGEWWLTTRDRLRFQDDPAMPWNQSYDEFQKTEGPPFNKKGDYKRLLQQAIRDGFVVEDDRLTAAGIKTTKADKANLAQNAAQLQADRALDKQMRAAIDHPLISDDEAKSFKPNMTTDDAMDYVNDSFFSGLSFYHGNPKSIIDSIQNDGGDPEQNNRGIFGKGVYFAASFDEAKKYAASGDFDGAKAKNEPAGVIATAIKMKNPLVIDSEGYQQILENFPGDQMTGIDSEAAAAYLRAKGHDGVYVKDYGYIVAMDKRQMVTHARTDYSRSDITDWDSKIDISQRTWNDVVKRTQGSVTGKALADL